MLQLVVSNSTEISCGGFRQPFLISAVQHNHLTRDSPARSCVPSPHLTCWTHSTRSSWFRCWPAERRRAARSALSLIICCLFVKLTAAREEYLHSLWSLCPSYSKLLAIQQHSSRPLGHPQAVQLWVPLPVIPAAGHPSLRLTRIVTTQVFRPTNRLTGSGYGWVYVGLKQSKCKRQGGKEQHSSSDEMANIPLKGSEGSLWASDKPALAERERARWQVQCSSSLTERNRKWQGLLHMGPLGCSSAWLGTSHGLQKTTSCNALNTQRLIMSETKRCQHSEEFSHLLWQSSSLHTEPCTR